MLGEFINRVLVLLLGYAYPAFECFKVVERNNGSGIQELRFWCKYWIIVAIVTVLEKFTDIIASGFPMYAELKLAFFIFLWYPKTQGTVFVYETLLRPWIVKHEPQIEEKLETIRSKSGELLMFYIKNFTSKGQSMILEVIHYIISHSQSKTQNKTVSPKEIVRPEPSAPPLPDSIGRSWDYDPTTSQVYPFWPDDEDRH
ncbi:receptor expression-enhancing protein 1/2/3/4 [Dioscorea alata]|uniref:Receptor expression-enhancing protein 1/2/3/4 n=1 Tax=Dioscorea alata TaxID=55571 RepID=A0ACB7VZY4_DIOAL|nr:receptor expression-enhancing protein 1/2/3/4 [Dioscorea alata]